MENAKLNYETCLKSGQIKNALKVAKDESAKIKDKNSINYVSWLIKQFELLNKFGISMDDKLEAKRLAGKISDYYLKKQKNSDYKKWMKSQYDIAKGLKPKEAGKIAEELACLDNKIEIEWFIKAFNNYYKEKKDNLNKCIGLADKIARYYKNSSNKQVHNYWFILEYDLMVEEGQLIKSKAESVVSELVLELKKANKYDKWFQTNIDKI